MNPHEKNLQTSGVDEPLSPAVVIRKLRFLIDAHHETVPGLARGIGVLPNTIQDVLDGQAFPSRALVRRIADRFSLPMEFFSAEVGSISEPKSSRSGKGTPRTRQTIAKKPTAQSRSKGAGSSTTAASTAATRERTSRTPKPGGAADAKTAEKSKVAPPGTAVLQQALIELLIQKGLISADEWNARVRLVSRRISTQR